MKAGKFYTQPMGITNLFLRQNSLAVNHII
jgi:hypothetical protein